MTPRMKAPARSASPSSVLAGWARQGVESFVAAQKILLDLTAQENALAIGMVRERLSNVDFRPGASVAKFADQSMEGFTTAGKILLELAAGETALVMDGMKEGFRLPVAAGTVAEVIRHRVQTLIGLQKDLLDAAAEQTHTVAQSYQAGKGLKAGTSLAGLARRGLESFVETEKKFLDLAAHEVTMATKGGPVPPRQHRERTKVLTHLAREGVEKYIDAQKKLLNLAIDQFESTAETATEARRAPRREPRTSFAELTEKSVRNLVTAQKSLMDLAIKPAKAAGTEEAPKTPRSRPRRKR